MDELGPYRLLRKIGMGGMGVVYEAEHKALRIRRALKVFNLHGEHESLFRERFLAEGRLLARLSHPGLVKVHDLACDEASGTLYYAMDLVAGEDGGARTLSDVEQGTVSEERLASWFAQLCDALDYIHSQGVVHRDVKPGNILLAPNGSVVLSDFGVSRIFADILRKDVGAQKTLSSQDRGAAGHLMGTQGFIAPEVVRGEPATPAADAYSLGVVFFRLLTGVWYDTCLAPGSSVTGATGVDSVRLLRNLDYNWSEIVPELLAADPSKRPRDLRGLAASLRPQEARLPSAAKMPRSRRRRLAAAIAAGIALAALVAYMLLHGFARPEPADTSSVPDISTVYAIPEGID